MSKRKTPDKNTLNGPKAKRQKLSHSTRNIRNHNNINNKRSKHNEQTIGTSRICINNHDHNSDDDQHENDENESFKFIESHCYDDDDKDLLSEDIIEIKQYNLLSTNSNYKQLQHESNGSNKNKNKNNNKMKRRNCDKLCSSIGQRVKIYWNEDKQWYYGTIKDYKSSSKQSLIVYDDGENEWLNLTKSGNETVEFLYDPINDDQNQNQDENNTNHNREIVKIGNKVSSGKVLSTFNHGCIANINLKLDNRTNSNFTAIAFDNKYIEYLINNQIISNEYNNTQDIFKLLHLCQFDNILQSNSNKKLSINSNKNGHKNNRNRSNSKRKSLRSYNGDSDDDDNDTINIHNGDNHNNNNDDNDANIPSWITIGCHPENDAITKNDSESHINLIHSANDHRFKHSRSNNGYSSSTHSRLSNNNSKKSRNGSSNVYNSRIGKNNNNITKKCNTKSIIDLKAIYPLQKIREQNHNKKRTIIIIGAGISGLSCARECMNYGYNVIVLEVE